MDLAINEVFVPDFLKMEFVKLSVGINKGRIAALSQAPLEAEKVINGEGRFLTPGLIDCHCHIESSFLVPSLFGDTVARCGTLHVVADCHEIANVAGRKGVEFFMEDGKRSPCSIYFAVPSCVPATEFATSGGRLDIEDITYLLSMKETVALGELMNVPGVIGREPRFMEMIGHAQKHGKRVNGHGAGLSGERLLSYVGAGVEDDHENETFQEVKEKIEAGLNVFLREGTAEHMDDGAYEILNLYPDKVMFCTDDKTINHIFESGHINFHLKKAVDLGIDPLVALKAASYNGLTYYGLKEYADIRVGNPAKLVLFEDLKDFRPSMVIVEGKLLKEERIQKVDVPDFLSRSLNIKPLTQIPPIEESYLGIAIWVRDGSLITEAVKVDPQKDEFDVESDLLKIVVCERYGHGRIASSRITGFNLKKGAIASSLAHDCHNIVAVGTSDDAILKAVNSIITHNGGLCVFDGDNTRTLSLPVGGIVSCQEPKSLSGELQSIKAEALALGSSLSDPLATLSFMALEVIPHLKLTDRGLFDVDNFRYWKG